MSCGGITFELGRGLLVFELALDFFFVLHRGLLLLVTCGDMVSGLRSTIRIVVVASTTSTYDSSVPSLTLSIPVISLLLDDILVSEFYVIIALYSLFCGFSVRSLLYINVSSFVHFFKSIILGTDSLRLSIGELSLCY